MLCSLGCGHSFCHLDVVQILSQQNINGNCRIECPTCRAPINSKPAINYTVKDIIEQWVKSKDADYNFAQWKGDEGYNIIASFFASQM